MKPYRHVGILSFFALCSQAFATNLFQPPNVNNQEQGQIQGQSATANSLGMGIAGSASLSTSSNVNTLNAGANPSTSASSVNITSPSEVTTRASGTTEVRTVATVFAPDAVTTANCMVGASGGATGLGWGFAIGTGIEDKGCTRRENARLLKNLGKPEAAVRIMCNDPEVAAALGDCPQPK
jgi:hypothetical protein